MRRRFSGTCCAAVVAAALAVQTTAAADPQTHASTTPVFTRFEQAAEDYARLHRELAAGLPPPGATDDPASIVRFFDALSTSLRAARANAHQGELFTPVLGAVIRLRIADAIARQRIDVDDLRAEMRPTDVVRINGTFSWSGSSLMLACVLDVLPALPRELQYRFAGEDLVLIDVDAGLVVDILPDALPGDTGRSPRLAANGGAI